MAAWRIKLTFDSFFQYNFRPDGMRAKSNICAEIKYIHGTNLLIYCWETQPVGRSHGISLTIVSWEFSVIFLLYHCLMPMPGLCRASLGAEKYWLRLNLWGQAVCSAELQRPAAVWVEEVQKKTKSWFSGQFASLISSIVSSLTPTSVCV